ncbi:ATP-dependent DNA helicase RecQ-like [Triticum dicoccoides]|uniref:ATP-dependent DNA helicase RecQ-like n=1 Tax=Triticum dicoccoides TaxID=85692 RepID=UPI0018909E45|nr:ATP-dependent DNA helicase RecQ-like [Triticum dicoccoides]
MEAALKRYFGYTGFRPYQREIVDTIMQGRDCLVVMATGSGKSMCYQIPPLVAKKTAVVVSPLLSLMQDQVMSLKQHGVRSEYLGSTQMNSSVSSEAEKGMYDVLYMTPEKAIALPSRFWSNLQASGICLFAIDEAHCISEWGHDFRPEYKQLHLLREHLLGVPFVALTATATERVRGDIANSLNLSNPHVAIGSFDRPNLFYGVKSYNRSMSFISELVKDVSKNCTVGGSTIIYCTTIRDTEQVHEAMITAGIKANIYHGKMGSKAREESHRSFVRDEVLVMVATIAFGMGIDKPDVRCVIHYGCPKSLESYYQESGRCGRDGLPSVCWLYYQRSDFAKADFYCSEATNATQRNAIMDSFMAAQKYCLLATCRRKSLLQYFGEERYTDCGNCDNCTGTKNERDLSKESFLLLSCVKSCGGRWGLNMPVDVLRGSRVKKILEKNYDKLPMHAMGKDYPPNWWKALGSLLMAHGYLKETVSDGFRLVSVSPKGVKFLSDGGTPLVLQLTEEMIGQEEQGSSQNKEGGLNPLTTAESEKISEEELKLYQMLLNIRMKLAQDIGTAPYAICGDQTLRHFAKIRPSTGARLANIDGVNQHFISRYSGTFVQNIAQLSKQLNLSLDDSSGVEDMMSVPKPVNNSLPRNLGDAKFTSWELWQKQEYSFKKIAHFRRAVPIKEQTVISYILDAARDGCEMNWNRFFEETGLTPEIASQIRLAIAKVGSRERMKPIKEELPENVTYEMIKIFFAADDLGVLEKTSGNTPTDRAPAQTAESAKPYSHGSEAPEKGDQGDPVIISGVCDSSPLTKRSQTDGTPLPADEPVMKLQKIDEQGTEPTAPNVATEDAILELAASRNGVSLEDAVKHFSGSKRESVVEMLESLRCSFAVYMKNGCYLVL